MLSAVTALYLLLAAISAWLIIEDSNASSRLVAAASARTDLAGSTELAWKSVLETLSLSFYSGATDTRLDIESLLSEAARRDLRAGYAAAALTALSLAYLAVAWVRPAGTPRTLMLVQHGLTIAAVCLVVGIAAPILALKAYTELPVLGEVIFKYRAKSVLTTIASLGHAGAWVVAVLVALFSVITPVLKLGLSAMLAQRWFPHWRHHAQWLIKHIGKWSMADVFLVAVMLAFFATGQDEFSDASVGLGLYFFAAYCVLSLAAGQVLLSRLEAFEALFTQGRAVRQGVTDHD